MRRHEWETARRILAVRLDAMGDLLMTTPALHALAGGRRHVTLLTSPAAAPVAALVPDVDDVLPFGAPWMKHATGGAAETRAMADELRRRRFDAAVIFTVWSQSALPAALLCLLAEVPLRLAHARENPYGLLTHWVPEPECHGAQRHEVQRQLDLVATIGATTPDDRLRVRVPPRVRAGTRALLAAAGIRPERPWAVVHPGATAASRRYPPESFAAVVRGLAEAGVQSVLVGTPDDEPAAHAIVTIAARGAVSLAGRTTLAQLGGVLDAAPLLIGNNSGPAHLAAAVGTPVVVLYALTNPQHTPWRVPHRVLSHDVPCRNCLQSVCPHEHHACLREVAPSQVVDAALSLLAEEAMKQPAGVAGAAW